MQQGPTFVMNHNQTRLIDAAQDSVQRTGLKALSFRTLADEVGIKSSSVHYYFPEKSDLARTLIERYRDTLFAALRQITESNQSLRHQFLAFADIFDEVARINRICLCSMMAAEFELLNKQNQTLLLEVFADMEGWLERLFDRH
jgi:TetR/AcrR family transcriptional repressor of nem operon